VTEKKQLNPILLIVVIVVGILIVGLAGYFVLIRPQGAKIKTIKKQQAAAEATLAAYHQKVLAARSAPKIRVADVYRLARSRRSRLSRSGRTPSFRSPSRSTGRSMTWPIFCTACARS
jgi:hypothetical protein